MSGGSKNLLRIIAALACVVLIVSCWAPADAGRDRGKMATAVFAKGGPWKKRAGESPVAKELSAPSIGTSAPDYSGAVPNTAPTTSVPPTTTAATAAPATTVSTKTPAPTPTTSPPVDEGSAPAPSSPPAEPASPTASSMPSGDVPGWRQVFAEDFTSEAALGSFAATYGDRWVVYGDGWKDTAGKAEGTPSRYFPSRVLSVKNGVLNKHLHTEDGINMVAAVAPKMVAQRYGRYSVRFRADFAPGYKMAWMLWPQSQSFPRDGEIDFPEGNLDENMWAFMHRQGATVGNDQDAFATDFSFTSWHTATIEWSPQSVLFLLDDHVVGRSTERIPNTPMDWILQTETCIGSCQPSSSVSGNVEIDWVVAYSYNP